jgi:hypothetical protein
MARGDLVSIRRLVHIDLDIGRRTIFKEHCDELAERIRKRCESDPKARSLGLTGRFDAVKKDEPGELKIKLDQEHESALLQTINEWMRDARALPDDVLVLRHALQRHGI